MGDQSSEPTSSEGTNGSESQDSDVHGTKRKRDVAMENDQRPEKFLTGDVMKQGMSPMRPAEYNSQKGMLPLHNMAHLMAFPYQRMMPVSRLVEPPLGALGTLASAAALGVSSSGQAMTEESAPGGKGVTNQKDFADGYSQGFMAGVVSHIIVPQEFFAPFNPSSSFPRHATPPAAATDGFLF